MAVCTAGNLKVLFDHLIEGEELLTVLKEGFKHLLFLRRQLPLPYLLLEREQTLENGFRNGPDTGRSRSNGGKCGHRPVGLRGAKARKRDAVITDIKSNLNALDCLESTKRIFALAIVFGSTIISPREVFLLRPKFGKSDEDVNTKVAGRNDVTHAKRIDRTARSLIRNLVTNPQLSSLCEMKPTNVFMFVLATRSQESSLHDGFLPKQGYKLPHKGKHYDIILTNEDTNGSNEADFSTELLNLQQEMDLIWYQAKKVLRGFSETKSAIF